MNNQNNNGKIPVVIGVTGHLKLRAEDRETLREAVRSQLESIRLRCPHTVPVLLCSLAVGADLLCAEVAEEMGIALRAVLPMEQAEYEKDFSPEDLPRFRRQAERAEKIYAVTPSEAVPEAPGRDFYYRQAGIHVAEHSHILLALWDGGEDGSGCGAAAAISVMLRGNWQPCRGTPSRNEVNALVIHIMTPRAGTDGKAGEIREIGNRELMNEILDRTDEFNRMAEEPAEDAQTILPGGAGREQELRRMENVYRSADTLSQRAARKYRRILAELALTGTVITLAFLLYDEQSWIWMILVCGAALVYGILTFRKAEKSACHRQYIEYRALAEAMRVQMFMRYAGSAVEVQRLMTWTQRMETAWILCAVCAMNAETPPKTQRDIRNCWAEDQRKYHVKAGERTRRQNRRNETLLGVILRCTGLLYLLTLMLELLGGGLIFRPVIDLGDPEKMRTLMKILLGTLSAGALFLADYYGKLSLERRISDHRKMVYFYRAMEERLQDGGQTESLLEELAREELTENGNWCSYLRDNAPELNL